MAIVISGVNNNDKITASDGTIDLLSGVSYASTITAPAFTTLGNLTAGHLNIGSGIQLGNAGIITATTLVGNVTGNVNHTSNLLLQISGSEKLRIANSGAFGLNGTNYGTSGQVLTSQGSGSSPTWTSIPVPPATTINNNADNRLITGSGTANTLNGEANLTFETATTGGTLTVAGTSEYQLRLKDSDTSGNGAETALAFTDSGNTIQGFVGYNYWGDGNLDIQNNNSGGNVCINTGGGDERVVIDSVGAITVQSALAGNTALAYLRNTRTRASGNKYGIEFRDSVNEANANIVIQQNSSGNNAAEMKFYVNGGTGGNGLENGNHILRLKQNKDVEIPDGNLIIGTSGHGIDFSSSAHASGQQSELLDDYERGSWTPQFWNARTGGTQLSNPSNTQAKYVKVGRIVYLHLGVHGLTKNWAGSNTQIFIRGLPYRSYFNHNGHCIRCGYFGPTGVTYSTFANLRQYDTYMELQKSGGAQGRYEALYWSDIHWEGYGNITCEMVYETDQGV